MRFHGSHTDIQEIAGFLVGVTLGDDLQHFAFPIREQLVAVYHAVPLEARNVIVLKEARHLASQERAALGHRANRLHHLATNGILK